MNKTAFFREFHQGRDTDHEIRGIVRAYRAGQISINSAIRQMREAGACEPEIVELIHA